VALGALALLAGCENKADKAASAPAEPKWKGAPYRIEFDKPADKPNPTGVTLPAVKYTANPDALETRVTLVVRFDRPGTAKDAPITDQMVMAPVDVKGTDGILPADYTDATNKELSRNLQAYCIKGSIKLSVALAKSSLTPHPSDAELTSKRLSDWLPIDAPFKNPHPKC
jgi:hypothetical protein